MIISRTPYRISFFGGGTDYHTWYSRNGGCVLSTTINHYCYLSSRFLPPFFPEKSRIVWSRIESVGNHDEIVHPSVRAILKYLNIENGIEIHHSGDLPARSGLGSSSAFTVGLLHAVRALKQKMSGKRELAEDSIHVERDLLKENVGIQDQIACSYGGFNRVSIACDGSFTVDPVIISASKLEKLQRHCLLFFTGISRTASDIALQQMIAHKSGSKDVELKAIKDSVDEAYSIIKSDCDIAEFGKLLHETWKIKRSLADNISPAFVDDMYERAMKSGALGGKLLGAGGGGFMLIFARPEHHAKILDELREFLWVPFKFEGAGSSIILYDPNSYSGTSLVRRDYQYAV